MNMRNFTIMFYMFFFTIISLSANIDYFEHFLDQTPKRVESKKESLQNIGFLPDVIINDFIETSRVSLRVDEEVNGVLIGYCEQILSTAASILGRDSVGDSRVAINNVFDAGSVNRVLQEVENGRREVVAKMIEKLSDSFNNLLLVRQNRSEIKAPENGVLKKPGSPKNNRRVSFKKELEEIRVLPMRNGDSFNDGEKAAHMRPITAEEEEKTIELGVISKEEAVDAFQEILKGATIEIECLANESTGLYSVIEAQGRLERWNKRYREQLIRLRRSTYCNSPVVNSGVIFYWKNVGRFLYAALVGKKKEMENIVEHLQNFFHIHDYIIKGYNLGLEEIDIFNDLLGGLLVSPSLSIIKNRMR